MLYENLDTLREKIVIALKWRAPDYAKELNKDYQYLSQIKMPVFIQFHILGTKNTHFSKGYVLDEEFYYPEFKNQDRYRITAFMFLN